MTEGDCHCESGIGEDEVEVGFTLMCIKNGLD